MKMEMHYSRLLLKNLKIFDESNPVWKISKNSKILEKGKTRKRPSWDKCPELINDFNQILKFYFFPNQSLLKCPQRPDEIIINLELIS